VTLTQGKHFGPLLIESDALIATDRVHAELIQSLDELRSFLDGVPARLDVIDHVVVLPQAQLCQPKLYPGGDVPGDCSVARSEPTFGAKSSHMLLVADDAGTLPDAIKTGVAQAVCVFQPKNLAQDQVDKICAMTKQFAPH
jgi:hypothetical protein